MKTIWARQTFTEGIAAAPAVVVREQVLTPEKAMSGTAQDEAERFARAVGRVCAELTELAGQAEAEYLARPVPEGGWACERCGAPNGSNVFCTECGSRRSAEK